MTTPSNLKETGTPELKAEALHAGFLSSPLRVKVSPAPSYIPRAKISIEATSEE